MNSAMSAWETTTLGEACEEPQYGFTASAQARDTGTRFLRITDLREGSLNWNEVPFCDCRENEIDRYQLQDGDLVVARIGATTGRTSLALSPPRAVFASYLIRLRPKTDINSFFLYFFTQSSAYWNSINSNKDSNLKGGVNAGALTRLELPKPPLAEQQKIAALLWKIQKAVEIEDAIVRNARDLKKSLMRRLFTHGLRGEPLKETEIGPVPESWEVVKLGDIAQIGNGSTPKRDNTAYWQRGTIPWLTSAKIYDRVIEHADEFVTDVAVRECHLPRVKPGSLLIAITGQGKTLGNAAISAIETTISQHLAFAQFKRTDVEPNFIRFFVDGQYELLRQVASGGGSTKGALTCGFLKSFPVPLATAEEQREIADILQTVDRKIDIHESKKRSLQEIFKTMLHKLMTAQIRVNDLEIDTSEVGA